jgi:hypothetical protein
MEYFFGGVSLARLSKSGSAWINTFFFRGSLTGITRVLPPRTMTSRRAAAVIALGDGTEDDSTGPECGFIVIAAIYFIAACASITRAEGRSGVGISIKRV